eukprot:c52152_g1_i1.p1 GENE.c52152_g1_i1~~c52152_g1_i1.p1  ORF type:complete len:171 (+),score=41.78 c52152_g1_i1:38-514(+)
MSGRVFGVLVDDSEGSLRAFNVAVRDQREGDELHLIHANQVEHTLNVTAESISLHGIPNPKPDPHIVSENVKAHNHGVVLLNRFLAKCQKESKGKCVPALLDSVQPHVAVCDFAEERDLKVLYVGQRGVSAAHRTLLGSFSDYVLHHAKVNVQLVKRE